MIEINLTPKQAEDVISAIELAVEFCEQPETFESLKIVRDKLIAELDSPPQVQQVERVRWRRRERENEFSLGGK